jgi:hypothetical protein
MGYQGLWLRRGTPKKGFQKSQKNQKKIPKNTGPYTVFRVWAARRTFVRGALWASLTQGGRSRSCNLDPRRKVGIGHGHSYGCQQRRCASLELERMHSPMRRTSFVSCFAHHAVRSRPSVPPKVRASRRHLRARMVLSHAGVVQQMDSLLSSFASSANAISPDISTHRRDHGQPQSIAPYSKTIKLLIFRLGIRTANGD